ncbi:MAG: RNA polymerase sigma factor [Candidatus Eremiobacteraeota bacterium]|nr:RNA polymerase sigma factor [Candidatus Eremiobacteraeota bacterium]
MDALVDAFTARTAMGLEGAYALWSRELYGVARHALGDDALAEDCVHDALLRVWHAPNRFEGNRQMLRAYLLACVRNEAIATLRSRARRAAREQRAFERAPDEFILAPAFDPVEAERLHAALARLPVEQRAALELAYFGYKTHVEVAAELGVALGTIKSRISLAMRKLSLELAEPRAPRT